nr:RNA-dependent RNA polymerase [Flumine sobemo-like virus 3]
MVNGIGRTANEISRLRQRVEFIATREVHGSSSPGFPMASFGSTNERVLTNHLALVCDIVVERLQLLSSCRLQNETPAALVRAGFCDPVRVFTKLEPHSPKKLRDDRYRLISSVSLVDQIIERLLFGNQNKQEIESWESIPSKPGMGLDDDGLKTIFNTVTKQSVYKDLMETDMSSWDWTVQGWELELDGDVRCDLYGLPQHSDLRKIIMNRVYCLRHTVFCLSDGTLYESLVDGIQLSGSYNTSSTNSRIRVLLLHLASAWHSWDEEGHVYNVDTAPWIMAMGDDSIEEFLPYSSHYYTLMGHIVKQSRKFSCGEPFEFCSNLFPPSSWKARPCNPSKMLVNLFSGPVENRYMRYHQWKLEMRYHPDLDRLDLLVREIFGSDPADGQRHLFTGVSGC